MRYLNILDCSIVDGEGFRVVLFTAGCPHHCKGCHNPESWDYNAGKPFTEETIEKIIKILDRPYIKGLTISGGEPIVAQNIAALTSLCSNVKSRLPDKDIWLYTGFKFEKISYLHLLKFIDVVVDGEFELDKRDITLPFRGSSNQRIIRLR